MMEGAQPRVLWWPGRVGCGGGGVEGTFKKEGTYGYLWMIHIVVWQKPTQHCKCLNSPIKKNKAELERGELVTNRTHLQLFQLTEQVKRPSCYLQDHYHNDRKYIWEMSANIGWSWGQEEKGMTEDEMAGWHHWLDGRESEWTPGAGDGQGGLECCVSWDRKEFDMTERLN